MRVPSLRALPALALSVLLLAGACTGDDNESGSTVSANGLTVGGLDTEDTVGDGTLAGQAFTTFDGADGTFAEFVGKPLVINFWGSWCTPCVKEMPDFESVHRELGDRVTFVGVNVSDTVDQAKAMAASTGVTYHLVRDPRNELLRWFGGTSMPTTAFVNADGNIAKVVSKQLKAEDLKAEIEAIA